MTRKHVGAFTAPSWRSPCQRMGRMNVKRQRLNKGTADDWPSLALLEFTVALARTMKASQMNQKALAEALGVSAPYISSVMSGNENLTVEQMSRLAEAAGGSLHVTIAPKDLRIRWVEDNLGETATDMPTRFLLQDREVLMSEPRHSPESADKKGHSERRPFAKKKTS
jgi:transcriptional regulator with XRE-family HTH domain